MKSKFKIFLFIAFMFFSSTAYAATFKGKVIDADTKEPIEGAVVVAEWHEHAPTPTGGHTRFKDVKETLTDKEGKWVIKGPRGWEPGILPWLYSILTLRYTTMPPQLIIFKPGYCSWPEGYLYEINVCKEKMKPHVVGNGETVELPKLTNREDRLRVLPSPVSGHDDMHPEVVIRKQKEFLRLINEERRNLGISEYRSYYEIFKEEK